MRKDPAARRRCLRSFDLRVSGLGLSTSGEDSRISRVFFRCAITEALNSSSAFAATVGLVASVNDSSERRRRRTSSLVRRVVGGLGDSRTAWDSGGAKVRCGRPVISVVFEVALSVAGFLVLRKKSGGGVSSAQAALASYDSRRSGDLAEA